MMGALLPMADIVDGHTGTGEQVLFWVLATVMVVGALGLLFSRKAIYAAMSMVLVMISMAVLYVTNEAPLLGMAQVVVYTGAVMMLFLFVLMLIGVDMSDTSKELLKGQRWIGLLLGIGIAAVLIGVIVAATIPPAVGLKEANGSSNPVAVAQLIFSDYVFVLEIVGILLITAAVGAVVLTHRERLSLRLGQKERSIERVKDGLQVPPLPAPGVYAHSNAADVPALDAAGEPLEQSVPYVLRVRGQVRVPASVELIEQRVGAEVATSDGVGPGSIEPGSEETPEPGSKGVTS